MRLFADRIAPAKLLVLVCLSLQVLATQTQGETVILIDSVTANVPNNINTPSVLINAVDDTNYSTYVAPNPGGGGGGTSWHTLANGTTPVQLVFNFAATSVVQAFAIWDYYGHTPTLWDLELFPLADAGGTNLLLYSFNTGSHDYDPQRVEFDVPDTSGVLSARLTTQNNAQWWPGVGLSEVAFAGVSVPEPSTWVMLLTSLPAVAVAARRRRRRAA